MGKTTANSIILLQKFSEERISGGFRRVAEALNKEDRKRIEDIKPEDWVEYDLYFRLLEIIANIIGQDVKALATDFGIYQAEHDTKLLHRMALKLGGPGIMIMEADQIWRRYHDTGHLKVYEVLPHSAQAVVEGLEGGGEILCWVIRGFIIAGLRLSGAKQVRVEHDRCLYRGDDGCHYYGQWE